MRCPPLFFVSGWAHGSEVLAPYTTSLGQESPIHLLSPDGLLLEAAFAEAAPGNETVAEVSPYADALAKRIGQDGEPACIMGWSMGGMVAMEVAAAFPHRVGSLILVSTTPRFCNGDGFVHGNSPAIVRAMQKGLKRNPTAVLTDFFARASLPLVSSEEELDWKASRALHLGNYCLLHGLDYLLRMDLRKVLGALRQPCLVVHGEEDCIVPIGAGGFLKENLARCHAFFLEGCGHILNDRSRNRVLLHIRDFLESLP